MAWWLSKRLTTSQVTKVPLAHRTCFTGQNVIQIKPRRHQPIEHECVERLDDDPAIEFGDCSDEYEGDWD